MKRLTREEAIQEHRKMWSWIAEETLTKKRKVLKEEYFSHFGIKDMPDADCYLCEYTFQQPLVKDNKVIYRCRYCPLCWDNSGDNSYFSTCIFHIFGKWNRIKSEDGYCYEEAARLAMEIANLPEKKEG